MANTEDLLKKIEELNTQVADLELKNRKLLENQVKLGEVTNNYLMLHYLNKNINECRVSQKLWETYLHNITDYGFNYDNAFILLESDESFEFDQKLVLDPENGEILILPFDSKEISPYVQSAIDAKQSTSSEDNTSVAIPIKSGNILRGVLVVFKNIGITFEDIELLEIYSQQTVSTIENITLNEKLMYNQELLGEKINQFVMLHYVSKEIHDSKRYYNVLEKYLNALTSEMGFNFKSASLYLLETPIQRVFLKDDKLQFEKIEELQNAPVSEAIAQRSAIVSLDEKSLCMPLMTLSDFFAVMEIESDLPIPPEAVQMLEIFAMQTSSMLTNTKLSFHLQSEVERQTAKLNNAYTELKKLDAMKDEFLAMVSHELRTPLTSIIAYLETIIASYEDDSMDKETEESFINIIHEESLRLKVIVDDVLDLSKLEAGKMVFVNENINLDTLLEKGCDNFYMQASNRNITIEKLFSDGAKTVFVDKTRVLQVISNILSNAIKFTPDNTKVVVSSYIKDGYAHFSIRDHGKGIKPEDAHKVFSRFEQIESVEFHSKGTGLGMPISKMIVEHMNGTIWFESDYGSGTEFIVKLPLT